MEQQSVSKMRTCEACGQEKAENSFYKGHDECRNCIRERASLVKGTLVEQAEARRQEKMLREELKKIAKTKFAKRQSARIERRRAATIKTHVISEGEKLEIDAPTRELVRRELQRRKLIEFTKAFHPRYMAGWIHHDICTRLEKFSREVELGLSPRLMLLVPPRHGKSNLASKMFPAWHLGHNPHHEWIGCSYGTSLALEFSREVRDMIKTQQYRTLFPGTRLNSEAAAAESWKLWSSTGVGAGGFNAAGVGGPITGKGAHILGIDDPIKNAEEADSVDIRQKNWDWYRSTAYTRLAPGGGVLIIQTCWHYDDLAGRIQEEMKDAEGDTDVDKFEIIRYPAIAEEDEEFRLRGEALHPERYNLTQLNKIKRTIGLRYWAALYQQSPIIEEGAYFTKDMIRYRNEALEFRHMQYYIAWDFAISEKQQNDWTVGTVIAQDYNDDLHVIKMVRFKTNDATKIIEAIIDLYKEFPNASFGAEDGQIWRTLKVPLQKRMRERNVYIPLATDNILKPIRDKMVRARPLQARMQLGKVTFPRGATWVDDFTREALRFPAGAHDDTIDSLAWAVHIAAGKAPPQRPRPTQRKREKTVAEQLKNFQNGGRSGGGHMAA